jgi:hypothetical protein
MCAPVHYVHGKADAKHQSDFARSSIVADQKGVELFSSFLCGLLKYWKAYRPVQPMLAPDQKAQTNRSQRTKDFLAPALLTLLDFEVSMLWNKCNILYCDDSCQSLNAPREIGQLQLLIQDMKYFRRGTQWYFRRFLYVTYME